MNFVNSYFVRSGQRLLIYMEKTILLRERFCWVFAGYERSENNFIGPNFVGI